MGHLKVQCGLIQATLGFNFSAQLIQYYQVDTAAFLVGQLFHQLTESYAQNTHFHV
jgi:hypothetical protein